MLSVLYGYAINRVQCDWVRVAALSHSPRFLLATSVLKQREVSATVSSFYVSVLYTAILRTSIAAFVLCCFYFCPLDCDIPVMVVDCAAVETGCMLEKYVPGRGFNKTRVHFYFLVEVLLLPTTSVLKRGEVTASVSFFPVSATTTAVSFASIILLLLLLRRDMHFHFLFEVLLLLIIFLVGCAAPAAGACAAYVSTEAERGTG